MHSSIQNHHKHAARTSMRAARLAVLNVLPGFDAFWASFLRGTLVRILREK